MSGDRAENDRLTTDGEQVRMTILAPAGHRAGGSAVTLRATTFPRG